MRPTKAEYYFLLAKTAALRSNCVRRHVGAVIVVDDRVVSIGYNGTPRGYKNCDEGGCPRCNARDMASGMALGECLCIHAEENCIIHAANYGASVKNGVLYTLLSPCLICSKMIVNSGIRKVNFLDQYPANGMELMGACGVEVYQINETARTSLDGENSWKRQLKK